MGYKVLTKQQWDSLPADKKYQMRYYSPDLYNYYQDRYVPKAEPVAEKERDTGTEKRSAPSSSADGTFNPDDWKSRVDDPDEVAAFLNDYYGQNDPTGQNRLDDEYYDTLPQEMQWLIEDQAEFASLVKKYLKGDITYEELQEFKLSDYGDAGTRFVEFYEEMQTRLLPKQAPVEEAEGPTQSEILGSKGAVRRYDKEGNLVSISYDGKVYKQDDSGQWVAKAPQESTGDGGVTVLPGTWVTKPDTSEETKVDPYIPYELPENEAVDVTELTEEQQTDIWGKIKEGLGKISGAVGKVIFGPDGMPTNVDEWIEWVDKTLQAQMGPENLPFPIVITTNPNEGTWIDLKIPINLDVNGTPIRIPLFDEDGNFVSSEELGKAWVDAKGQIFGPLGEIGEIFLDDEGNIKLDLGDLKDVLLGDLTLNPDGSITGSTAGEILIGKWFFNSETGEWEEEVEASLEEVGLDEGDEDGLADTTDGDTTASTDDDELGGVFEEEDEDEEPVVVTEDDPIVVTEDDPIVVTEDDPIVVTEDDPIVVTEDDPIVVTEDDPIVVTEDDPIVVTEDDPIVVTEDDPIVVTEDDPIVVTEDDPIVVTEDDPIVVTEDDPIVVTEDDPIVVTEDDPIVVTEDDPIVVTEDDPIVVTEDDPIVVTEDDPIVVTEDDPIVVTEDDPIVVTEDDPIVVTEDDPIVVTEDDPIVVTEDDPIVVTEDDPIVVTEDDPIVVTEDDPIVVTEDDPIVVTEDDPIVVTEDDPIVVTEDDPIIVEESPEEPLVGATGPAGATGATGAGGAAGRDAPRGGMMGGLSYNLPGFVGVQYQPKDYTVELNRIINESLFKGMI
jgi:hypothetical protein